LWLSKTDNFLLDIFYDLVHGQSNDHVVITDKHQKFTKRKVRLQKIGGDLPHPARALSEKLICNSYGKVIMNFKTFFKGLSDPKFASYALAKKYIRYYEGFSYDFAKNGELFLLDSLESASINIIFDVGANIGRWSKISRDKFPNAYIYAFELSQKTFLTLKNNLSKENRVVSENIGLSNQSGDVLYKDYGENSPVNTILYNANFHDFRIKPKIRHGTLSTGDEYCQKNNIQQIDLLKIDVEGAEHLVLYGFEQMLKKKVIRMIQFEYGYANGDAKFLIKDFYKLMEDFGYVTGPLKPNGVCFMDFQYPLNDFNSGPNYVSVLKNETSLIKKISNKGIRGFPR